MKKDSETFSSVNLRLLLHQLCVCYILNKCPVVCRFSVIELDIELAC